MKEQLTHSPNLAYSSSMESSGENRPPHTNESQANDPLRVNERDMLAMEREQEAIEQVISSADPMYQDTLRRSFEKDGIVVGSESMNEDVPDDSIDVRLNEIRTELSDSMHASPDRKELFPRLVYSSDPEEVEFMWRQYTRNDEFSPEIEEFIKKGLYPPIMGGRSESDERDDAGEAAGETSNFDSTDEADEETQDSMFDVEGDGIDRRTKKEWREDFLHGIVSSIDEANSIYQLRGSEKRINALIVRLKKAVPSRQDDVDMAYTSKLADLFSSESGELLEDQLQERKRKLKRLVKSINRDIEKYEGKERRGMNKPDTIEALAVAMEGTNEKWKLPQNRIYKPSERDDPANGKYYGVVNTTNFMNWFRDQLVEIHNDDPNTPANFGSQIMVDNPDLYRPITWNEIRKFPGTFLTSGHIDRPMKESDERSSNPPKVTYDNLKDELIYEMWLHGGFRNKDIDLKSIMYMESKNAETVMRLTADNMVTKEHTMEQLYTTPESFEERFDENGNPIVKKDNRLGSAMRAAFLMYYNMADYEGLVDVVGGTDALIFSKTGMRRALHEVMQSKGVIKSGEIPDDIAIDKFAAEIEIDINGWYGEDGLLKDAKAIEGFIDKINIYNLPDKDPRLISLSRKLVELQAQRITGVKKGGFGSEYAELIAFHQTYLGGAASRNDTGMSGYVSDTKPEYPTEYQKKQLDPWRGGGAGNVYSMGVLNRIKVDYFSAMPTKSGKSLLEIMYDMHDKDLVLKANRDTLRNNIREDIVEHYQQKGLKDYEIEGLIDSRIEAITALSREFSQDEVKLIEEYIAPDGTIKEGDDKEKVMGLINDQKDIAKEVLRRDGITGDMEVEANKFIRKWIEGSESYNRSKTLVESEIKDYASKIIFNQIEWSQWGSNQAGMALKIYQDITSGADIDPSKFTSVDIYGKTKVNQEAFIETISDNLIKPARYAFSTYEMPLGQIVRRKTLVDNPDIKRPLFDEVTLAETIYGREVWKMAQKMISRQNPGIRFADSDGNIINRDALISLLSNDTKVVMQDWESDAKTVDMDKILVKAYVKTRLARMLLSHTEKDSPYPTWEFEVREALLSALPINPYFTKEDIKDIRSFSKNQSLANIKKEFLKGGPTGNAVSKGFWDGFKYFFGNVLK